MLDRIRSRAPVVHILMRLMVIVGDPYAVNAFNGSLLRNMAMMFILANVMRSTNIADFRSHLTRYLKEVRAGEEFMVRDRQLPFVKIIPLATPGKARI